MSCTSSTVSARDWSYSSRPRKHRHPKRHRRLLLERLEDRRVLSGWTIMESEECTVGVFHGSVTMDGRPLLVKVRDIASDEPQQLVYRQEYAHPYIGVRSQGGSILMGLSTSGVASGNAVVNPQDLSHTNSGTQRYILGNFSSMDEIETYFQQQVEPTSTGGRGNFPFLDAAGNAAMFELNGPDWSIMYDALDANRATQGTLGYVVRANEFHERLDGTDNVTIAGRYASASHNVTGLVGMDMLSHRTLLQGNSGADGFEFVRYGPGRAKSMIARSTSRSAIVVQGVAPGEDPSLATMWTVMGQPNYGIAVPAWASVSDIPPVLADGQMYARAQSLYGKGAESVTQASVFPMETHIFDQVDGLQQWWHANGISSTSDMTRIQQRIAIRRLLPARFAGRRQSGQPSAPSQSAGFRRHGPDRDLRRLRQRPGWHDRRLRMGFRQRPGQWQPTPAAFSFSEPGTYLVSLTVHDNDGVSNTAWQYYDVVPKNNTLLTALDLGVLDGTQTFADYVGPDDPVDYVRFTVTDTVRAVTVGLQAHWHNADGYASNRLRLDLIEDQNADGQVQSGEILGERFGGAVSLTRWLDPGEYYVRVRPYLSGDKSTYTLTLTETARPDSPGRHDNRILTAKDVGILNGQTTAVDFVGTSDTVDFVRFEIAAPVRQVTFGLQAHWHNLDGYASNRLRLELIEDINKDGIVQAEEILGSRFGGQSSFTRWLDPGTYYVRIRPYVIGDNSTYTLTLSETPRPNSPGRQDNGLRTALDVGILNGPVRINDFVGTTDRVDFVKFAVTVPRREVTVGVVAHWYGADGYASNRLRLELIEDRNGDGLVQSGEILASTFGIQPSLTRWLDPGSYYVRILPYLADDNSTYTLTLTIPHEPLLDLEPGQFQRTETGFVYPTGRGDYADNMPGWLAGGPDIQQSYRIDYYHLGADMDSPRNAPVYAIADGEIVYVSTVGWGAGNYGLFVRHRLENGQEFLALYGHVRPTDSSLQLGNTAAVHPVPVRAGEVFATLGPADGVTYYDDHLHFGIVNSADVPGIVRDPADPKKSMGFGRAHLDYWPQNNGFVNPLAFIETQRPSGAWTSHGTSATKGLSAQAISPDQVQLTWQPSTNEVTGVQIERRSFGQAAWELVSQLWGNVNSFVDQTVGAATSYYYRVKDWMGGILSSYSDVVSIIPNQAVAPRTVGVEPTTPEPTEGHSHLQSTA
jgi:hypothetical protein